LANTPAEVELLTSGDPWVIAYDPDSGVELWRAKGLSDDVAPSPVYANGLVFVTNEYAQIMAIRAGGSGDVTATHVAWTATEGLSDAASPIATDEFFLQANSSGNVTCFEAQSGKLLWEQSFEGVFWASPTLAGDVLYLPAEDGKTYLFKLAREYAPLGAPDLGEPILATPAFTDGQIFIRGKKHLFCITRKTGDR
jgi:outer membrane protein assembly factor BamB